MAILLQLKVGVQLDNRWVIPHNISLITKYNAHINVEICNSILAIKYLYMYVYKGHDRATVTLSQANNNQEPDEAEPIDDILMQDIFLLLKVFGKFSIIDCIIILQMYNDWSKWRQFATYCKSCYHMYDNFDSLVSRKSREYCST